MNASRLLAFAGVLASAGPALAKEPTGFRAELTVGYDGLSSHDNYDELPGTLSGARLGGAIGYDVAVTRHLLLGVEAGAGWTVNDRRTVSLGSDRLSLSTGRDLDFSLRAGTPIGARTIAYAKAGYANSRVKLRYDARTPGGGTDTDRAATNGDGLRLGAGLERQVSGNAYIKAEYRWTRYYGRYAYQQHPTRNQVLLGAGVRFR